MKAGKFFPVPYMGHLAPDVQELRYATGRTIGETLGLWHILLGFMYEYEGSITLNDAREKIIASNMGISVDELRGFLKSCAEVGLIDSGFLAKGKITSNGVQGQVDYKNRKREVGKLGGRPKKNQDG